MKLHLTQAQNLLLQGILTLLLGVAVTALTSGYQAFISGHLDATMLASFVFNSFLIGAGNALRSYIPAHIPQELQALKDSQQQVADGQQEILSIVNGFTAPRVAIPKQPTAPTGVVPTFTPPARPATAQTQAAPPQVAFPTQPGVPQAPTPDLGG